MKKVLVSPRFVVTQEGVARQYISSSLSDFLTKNGFFAFSVYCNTKINSYEEAEKWASIYIVECDGIILQGGNDIHPSLYNEINLYSRETDVFRDLFELALIRLAAKNNIPVFGICRGMQLINVAFGGSLHQRLKVGQWQKHITHADENGTEGQVGISDIYHPVIIEKGGYLERLDLEKKQWVNSVHYQGVNRLGEGVFVEATAEDGLVEALSVPDKNILGIQWHPELDFDININSKPLLHWLNNI